MATKMKSKASGLVKQMISVVTSLAKAKALALKNKTSALKARLIIFSLLRNKRVLLSSISQKLQALLGQEDNQSNAIVVCNYMSFTQSPSNTTDHTLQLMEYEGEEEEEDKYPDLTPSLFKSEELDLGEDPAGSVIELAKNSKLDGQEFRLEDEIDHLADLFIKKFHRQMRIQKQQSFKRYQEMLERSV